MKGKEQKLRKGWHTREYLYAGSTLLATINSGGTKYHYGDHLSARVTTDSTGNKAGQQGHFPFGESWYTANTTTKWQFTSYERDAESGNDYAMARYYSSRLARFTSVDPLPGDAGDPQSINRYSYVRNDPIDLIDPSGMDYCSLPHKSTAQNDNREKIWFAYNDVFDGRMGPSSLNSDDSDIEQTPADPNSSQQACSDAGGIWIVEINVHGDFIPIDPWTIGNHTGLLPGGGLGGGGNSSGAGSFLGNLLKVAKKAYCSAVPSGRVVGVGESLGGIGSVGGSVALLQNYNTGEVSVVSTGSVGGGWNGGATATAFVGNVWGLGNSNANYGGGSVTLSGGSLLGGDITSSSNGVLSKSGRSLVPNGKVITVAISGNASLLGSISLTATAGGSDVRSLGLLGAIGAVIADPTSAVNILARQPCRKE